MHVSKTTICKKQTIENTDHRFYARKQPNSWTSMTTTFGAMAGLANAKNRVLYVALAEQTRSRGRTGNYVVSTRQNIENVHNQN